MSGGKPFRRRSRFSVSFKRDAAESRRFIELNSLINEIFFFFKGKILFTWMMNVFVSNHVLANVNVNENDGDYNDDVKVMKTYDDDHHNYLLPYLQDEDQHPLAKKTNQFSHIISSFFSNLM